MEKQIQLSSERIKELYEESENGIDYLLRLYAEVIPNWDCIKLVDGFPAVSNKTAEFILDTVRNEKISFGMLWMNKGFGCSNPGVEDWIVDISNVQLIYK